ncbi:hypothetical protein B5D82_01045 [Cognaticolwellia beringensis]|uniref:Uncharacterized protein n=1 Tax=Cognaticolwellia beringensis TaxID=1967665 RepID=A0A222G4G1_9GAMM|nr:hypothetical protein B5D82_01045 [Cognaticolwellia beringensis]
MLSHKKEGQLTKLNMKVCSLNNVIKIVINMHIALLISYFRSIKHSLAMFSFTRSTKLAQKNKTLDKVGIEQTTKLEIKAS